MKLEIKTELEDFAITHPDIVKEFKIRQKMVEEVAYGAGRVISTLMEEQVTLAIRPCPWWIPVDVWRWLASRFLAVESRRTL